MFHVVVLETVVHADAPSSKHLQNTKQQRGNQQGGKPLYPKQQNRNDALRMLYGNTVIAFFSNNFTDVVITHSGLGLVTGHVKDRTIFWPML